MQEIGFEHLHPNHDFSVLDKYGILEDPYDEIMRITKEAFEVIDSIPKTDMSIFKSDKEYRKITDNWEVSNEI